MTATWLMCGGCSREYRAAESGARDAWAYCSVDCEHGHGCMEKTNWQHTLPQDTYQCAECGKRKAAWFVGPEPRGADHAPAWVPVCGLHLTTQIKQVGSAVVRSVDY